MQDKKNKQKTNQKSSKKVADFLEKNNIHKKDFALMIGVTQDLCILILPNLKRLAKF